MRELIEETLKKLEPEIKFSKDAVNLLLGTMAQESSFGKYRRQLHNGPALGIFQMEPNTFNDIVKNYLKYHPDIKDKIMKVSRVPILSAIDLISNDRLAICMCRVHYLRQREAIPSTVEGYADLWKLRYNTVKGKGTVEEFLENYKLYVG